MSVRKALGVLTASFFGAIAWKLMRRRSNERRNNTAEIRDSLTYPSCDTAPPTVNTPIHIPLLRAVGISAVTCLMMLAGLTFVPMLWGWQPVVLTSNSMSPWMKAGDVALIDTARSVPKTNDIVTFDSGRQLITHRVLTVDSDGTLVTKGDANTHKDSTPVPATQVHGVAKMVVPLVGTPAVAIQHGNWLRLGVVIALCVAGFIALKPVRRPKRMSNPGTIVTVAIFSAVAVAGTSAAAFSSSTNTSAAFASGPGYYSTIMADNPVSYWRLGENAGGTTGADVKGVGNLTYFNSPTLGAPGALAGDNDTAMTTTSTRRAAAAPNTAHVFSTAGSVEAWIKPSAFPQGSNARVVSTFDGSALNYLLAYDAAGRKMRFLVELSNSTRPTATTTTELTNLSHWYHLVGTWDGSNVRIYIDGVLEQTTAAPAPIKPINSGVVIANDSQSNTGLTGTTDEVTIWNRVLSGTEITNHHNRGRGS